MASEKGGPGAARISLRVGDDVLGRAARLTSYVGRRRGARATREDVLREALLRGLAVLERSEGGSAGGRRR